MATTSDLLVDAFDRIRDLVHSTTDGLSSDQLTFRVDDTANSIAWLVWHLTRVQDDHVADLAGLDQVWLADGYAQRFGLPFENEAIGYGQTADEVGALRASAENLIAYHDAVHAQTVAYLRVLTDADLDDVVDANWDPPVTRAVRLISVVSDDLQHVGQAAFVRGLLP